LIIALGIAFLAFEEISWGQRIFNLETPETFSSNVQEQITIHNLKSVIVYLHDFLMIVGFVGSFAWIIFKKLPSKYHYFKRFLVPSWYLMFYFIPIFVFYFIGYFMPYNHQIWELGDFLPMMDQEPPELLLSIGIMLFFLISFIRIRSSLTMKS